MAYYKCGKIFATQNSNTSIETASGAIANFNTQLAMPVLGCNAEFSASQASGTPTPSAPIPIVGVDKVNITRTGKNLVSDILTGMTVASNGSIVSSGSSNSLAIAPVKSGYRYTITTDDASNFVGGFFTDKPVQGSVTYNGSRIVGQAKTFTAPIDGWVAFRTSYEYATAQLEFGETATTYEAPTVVNIIINLGGTYYGGSIDAVTGKITLTHEIRVYDGTENGWNKSSTYNGSFYINTGKRHLNRNAKCSHAEFVSSLGSYVYGKFALDGNGYVNLNAFVQGTGVDLPTFKTWLATEYANGTPLTTTLELETPIVVYASNTAEIPTLNGDNQVYADTGDVEVKYRKLHSDN